MTVCQAADSGCQRISVVIPTLNEAVRLEAALNNIPEGFHEVIVADGGSVDDTVAIAHRFGARVVHSPPGRGGQLNTGAAQASGDTLLFLHADTALPVDAAALIRAAFSNPEAVYGGFSLTIDCDDYFVQMVARTANWRTRKSRVVYGDQAPFVRAGLFREIGGFQPIPIMEDVALGRVLKRRGRVVLLDALVVTSGRRWLRENPLYVTVRNWVLVLLYLAGVSPHRLARWYRPEPAPDE